MRCQWFISLFYLLGTACLSAQTDSLPHRYALSSTMVGVSQANVYDSYLSPLEYTGIQAHIVYEHLRQLKGRGQRWHQQWLAQAYLGELDTGLFYQAMLNANYGWFYRLTPIQQNFQCWLGPQADIQLGALANQRNSNNPAQAKASVGLDASGMAIYRFRLGQIPFIARYQLSLPLVGAQFSPEYGESYYEIFVLGSRGKHLLLTHPLNALSARHLLSLDFPLAHWNLRVAYLWEARQSTTNHIRQHQYAHAFLIGITRSFYLLKGKRKSLFNPHYPAF